MSVKRKEPIPLTNPRAQYIFTVNSSSCQTSPRECRFVHRLPYSNITENIFQGGVIVKKEEAVRAMYTLMKYADIKRQFTEEQTVK